LFGLSILILLIVIFAQSDKLFLELEKILEFSEAIISQYPIAGKFLFIVLSAVSAMLAFFSSAILVPIGVHTWGMPTCFVLLWIGWFLGGLCAYIIGYYAGGSLVSMIIGQKRLNALKQQISTRAKFLHILLFQSALPSEVPGYVLGSLKFRADYYLAALAITEIPYAFGTVFLGESFLQRNLALSAIIIVLGILIALFAYRLYKQHLVH